jgi:hypothetical protein
MDPAHIMAFIFFSIYFNILLILIYFHKCHVVYSLKVVPIPHLSRVLHAQSIIHWFYRPYSSWRQNSMHFRVTLYWEYLIVLWLFHLVCILYCGCFNLFCNVWLYVRMYGFCNMCECVYVWVF